MTGKSARRQRQQWVLLGALLLLLLAAFLWGYHRSEASFFPRWFDQVDYRCAAARIATGYLDGGPLGFCEALHEHSKAPGYGQGLVGGLACLAGIDPALGVFLLFLLALPLIWFVTAKRGSRPLTGWLALALFLSLTSWSLSQGGARDFRPDFCSQFLWGTAAALALSGRCFSHRKGALAGGVVMGLCLATRSLALVYAVGALPLWLAAAWIGPGEGKGAGRRGRLGTLALAGGVALLFALPFLLLKYDLLADYYLDNHLSSRELVAREFTGGMGRNLLFYVEALVTRHLGLMGILVPLGIGFLGLWTCRGGRRLGPVLVLLGFLSPLPIMSVGPQLNPVVPGIVGPPLALFALIPFMAGAFREGRRLSRPLLAGLVVMLLVWPVTFVLRCEFDRAARLRRGHHTIAPLLDRALAEIAGRREMVVATLPLMEAVSAHMLELHAWRRTGRLPAGVRGGLGHTIFASASAAEFAAKLRASDLVFRHERPGGGMDRVQANREFVARRKLIDDILSEHYREVKGLSFGPAYEGAPLRLYIRRTENK